MNSTQSSSDKTVIELALVTVRASGDAQDQAAEIVSIAGGRLLSLDDHGFTAQVTNRPEAIDHMIGRLEGSTLAAIVRSGGLSLKG
jgi:acetolactate synthase small subunit